MDLELLVTREALRQKEGNPAGVLGRREWAEDIAPKEVAEGWQRTKCRGT